MKFINAILMACVSFTSVSAYADALPPIYIKRTIELKRGENLATALDRVGVERDNANDIIAAIQRKSNLRNLQVGQKFEFMYKEEAPHKAGHVLEFTYNTRDDKTINVASVGEHYSAHVTGRELTVENAVAIGTISGSLYKAAQDSGLPAALVPAFANIFAHEIDFTRDIRSGNTFKVIYEDVLDEDGEHLRTGKIKAAQLTTRGKTYEAFLGEYAPGRFAYYDAKGTSKKRLLLKTPLNFMRISSHFNLKRKHPVLGYTRAHKGTDFAAPTGTPIWASGDGVIEKASWYGGYGRYVRIRHNGTFKTAYAHMSRFAKGMRAGKRVRQGDVIGYVGTSGRSTGPHLHYEVLKNNAQVNPMRAKLPTGNPMPKSRRNAFLTEVASLKNMWRAEEIQMASSESGSSI